VTIIHANAMKPFKKLTFYCSTGYFSILKKAALINLAILSYVHIIHICQLPNMILFTVALNKFIKLMHCPQNRLEPLFCRTSLFNLANMYKLL